MSHAHDVFISYARKDYAPHVARLEADLQAARLRTWRDTRGIDPAQDFTAEIERAIENARCVVACITPDVRRENSFVRREIQYALVIQRPVLVARLADVPPPIHVIDNTWFEFHRNWEAACNDLLAALDRDPGAHPTTAPQHDPFRAYLEQLYPYLVDFLEQRVIRPIDLRASSTDDAVDAPPMPAPQPRTLQRLYRAGGGALPELPDVPPDAAPLATYTTFAGAVAHYAGRVLLLGAPGAGKTVTLVSYARDAVTARLEDPAAPLPLLGTVATWDARARTPLYEWLAADWGLDPEALDHYIRTGEALLLLDGLDELGEEGETGGGEAFDPRARFLDAIPVEGCAIVSCREQDYAAIGQRARLNGAVTLLPLDADQMRAYLADLPHLLAAVEGDADLREIVSTPLLMSLFAFAYRDTGTAGAAYLHDLRDSPADLRDEIMRAYVEGRYEWEASRRDPGDPLPFSLAEVYDVLGKVAMRNAAGGVGVEDNVVRSRDFMAKPDISREIARPTSTPRRVGFFGRVFGQRDAPPETPAEPLSASTEFGLELERLPAFIALAVHLNLLGRAGEDTWRFVHLLLRDYFAFHYAMRILNAPADRAVRRVAATTLLRLADLRAMELLIIVLQDEDAELRRLAAIALGGIRDTNAVQPLILALRDSDSGVRLASASALEKIGDPCVIPALIEGLGDDDHYVRRAVSGALEQFDDADRAEAFIKALCRPGHHYLVARMLDRTGSAGVDALIQALRSPDVLLRRVAADMLGQIGHVGSVEQLLAALQDADNVVRRRAAGSLGRAPDWCVAEALRSPCIAEALFTALQDSESAVRRTAAKFLGTLDEQQIAEALTSPGVVESLFAALRDLDDIVGCMAVMLLGLVRDPEIVESLVIMLRTESVTTAERIGDVLECIGSCAVEPLIAVLDDPDTLVHQVAVRVLGRIRDPRAVVPLCNILIGEDSHEHVRASAAQALGELGDPRAITFLRDTFSSEHLDHIVRKSAAQALGRINDPHAVDTLIRLLGNAEMGGALMVANTLVDIGSRAVEPLIATLSDTQIVVRFRAVYILGRIADPRAEEPLIAALRDSNGDFRAMAVQALGGIGGTRAIDALIFAFNDHEERVRNEAVDALVRIGSSAVVPLIAVLNDPQAIVRCDAALALGRLRDQRAVEPLTVLVRDRDRRVRYSANKALHQIGNNREPDNLDSWFFGP